MRYRHMFLMTGLLAVLAFGAASADTLQTVLLTSSQVDARQDAGVASPYTILAISIPPEVTAAKLTRAILEFRADVFVQPIDGWVNDTPVVEVYALSSDLTGSYDASKLVQPSAMKRPVSTGENRTVRIDITEAVRYWLANPSKNHGLVLGSFRGAREGSFVVKADATREGALAAVSFILE